MAGGAGADVTQLSPALRSSTSRPHWGWSRRLVAREGSMIEWDNICIGVLTDVVPRPFYSGSKPRLVSAGDGFGIPSIREQVFG